MGIREVNINCVFEDVWQKEDDVRFEEQLIQLADAIIEKDYYKEYVCSFFPNNWVNRWIAKRKMVIGAEPA